MSRPLGPAPVPEQAGAPAAARPRPPGGPPRRWLAAVALWASLTLVAGVWGLALPLMASPDEQSHVVKAAAVVRGQLLGDEDPDRDPRTAPGRPTLVELPQPFGSLEDLPGCHAFRDRVTADCSPDLAGDPEVTDVAATFAGRYPPLYYALVGWPSLLSSDVAAVYGMRALSAALAAVPLTAGLLLLLGTAVPRAALLGAGVALTPMALSLFGVVNPSALEIACAFCAWSALLAAVLAPDPAQLRRRVLAATAALAVMVNLRASAPLFGLLLVAAVLAVAPWPVLREVLRARVTWVAAAVGVAAGSASAAWVLGVGTLQGPVGRYPELAEASVAAREAAGRSVEYLRQMVGVFGWLDAPAPALTFLAWGTGLGALVVLALTLCARRGALVVAAVVVALVALPVVVQLPGAEDAGLIWQGRYLLPLAVGLPLLCALLLARDQPVLVRSVRLDAVLLPLLLVGHVGALHWVLRRYAVGVDGGLLALDPAWQPPLLGVLPVVALYAVALVGVVLLLRALSARPATVDAVHSHPVHPHPVHPHAVHPVPVPPGPSPARPRSRRSVRMTLAFLVTGMGGQLSTDFVEVVGPLHQVPHCRGLTVDDLDVTDAAAVDATVQAWARSVRADSAEHRLVVLNGAAYTAVDAAEADEDTAYAVNASAPALLAGACGRVGAQLLHVSTDYVFPGDRVGGPPYDVDDEPGPRSAYGRTKLAGELAVRELLPDASWVVRTAWVYGATGGNFVKTMARLEGQRETVDVVEDQVGSPTWSRDLARGLFALVREDAPAGTYHCTNRGETTWYEFTRAIFEELGADPDRVRPTTTDAFPRPAPRPAYAALSTRSWDDAGLPRMPEWRAALAEAFSTAGDAFRP